MTTTTNGLTAENFSGSYLQFQDRQAGISLVFCPDESRFTYNVYCLEKTLLKELFTVEHEYLEDALITVNAEFGQWELASYDQKKSGCGSCAAKKR
jgi:hypothetical protein